MRLTLGLTLVALLAGITGAQATGYTIVLSGMKFGPVPAELHVGDTITWQNDDIFRHSVTARDKSFDIDLPSKASARMDLAKAGSFAFFCKFHPGMTGTQVVKPCGPRAGRAPVRPAR